MFGYVQSTKIWFPGLTMCLAFPINTRNHVFSKLAWNSFEIIIGSEKTIILLSTLCDMLPNALVVCCEGRPIGV